MSTQLWALAAAGAVVLAAAGLELWRSRHARSRALGLTATETNGNTEPYILYFTGDSCSVCRTHQEPALAKLAGVRIDRIDAIAERELADRFQVYTLPTTVVMSGEGKSLNVNYGYAPTTKLERQLSQARGSELRTAVSA